ncbi:MAG: hypothetical protein N3I35_08805 [Clostridia bacterium]|nr:hypothetical protein [Clostridia bacterium]
MLSLEKLVVIIVLIWVALYTGSFGVWTWRKKNKAGAVMVFLITAAVLILPAYTLFFRQ